MSQSIWNGVTQNLQHIVWNCQQILHNIPSLNYNNELQNINVWNKQMENRNLTPLGKTPLIKTNFISKCIHLLTSLERSENFWRDLNTELYMFLWNNKLDKIKRSTIYNDYLKGGLKMVKIFLHLKKHLSSLGFKDVWRIQTYNGTICFS